MNIQEREEYFKWLKQLKVGDDVAVLHSFFGHKSAVLIGKVEAITPAGWVRVGTTYFVSGKARGSSFRRIEPVTAQVAALARRSEAQEILRNYNWSGESTETLLAVLEVLSAVEKKEAGEG
jgi:hypothetical protein